MTNRLKLIFNRLALVVVACFALLATDAAQAALKVRDHRGQPKVSAPPPPVLCRSGLYGGCRQGGHRVRPTVTDHRSKGGRGK